MSKDKAPGALSPSEVRDLLPQTAEERAILVAGAGTDRALSLGRAQGADASQRSFPFRDAAYIVSRHVVANTPRNRRG